MKTIRFLILHALLMGLGHAAIYLNLPWATNLLIFIVWLFFFATFIGFCSDDIRTKTQALPTVQWRINTHVFVMLLIAFGLTSKGCYISAFGALMGEVFAHGIRTIPIRLKKDDKKKDGLVIDV